MAHLLLLDDQSAAQRVFRSILERDDHHCDIAITSAEAWALLTSRVRYDLVVVELKLGGGDNGLNFVRRVRGNPLFQHLPLVVYTMVSDRRIVRKALEFRLQNYLIKPYEDEILLQEIARGLEQNWLSSVLAPASQTARQTTQTEETLREKRIELANALNKIATTPPPMPGDDEPRPDPLAAPMTLAAEAGAPGIEQWLRELSRRMTVPSADASGPQAAGMDNGSPETQEVLKIAARMAQIAATEGDASDTGALSAEALTATLAADLAEEEEATLEEKQERRRWLCAPPVGEPLVDRRSVLAQAAGLPGCPIIASRAAAFQMTVNAHLSNLSPIQHLVTRDPGLAAQILMSANRLNHDDMDPINGIRTAVGWLGNVRLQAMCKSLVTVEERCLRPLSWAQFWMFQMGVACMSEFVCQALEWTHMTRPAYNAGLMHDIGQLVLLRLHPHGFQAITRHARHCKVLREEAERRFLGCTAREAAEVLARNQRLPESYIEVIRHAGHPGQALRHRDLVAVVSLARHLCLKYQIGDCGEWSGDLPAKVEDTAAWPILNEQIYLRFNWRRFTMQAHLRIQRLKNELRGRLS